MGGHWAPLVTFMKTRFNLYSPGARTRVNLKVIVLEGEGYASNWRSLSNPDQEVMVAGDKGILPSQIIAPASIPWPNLT